MTVEIGTITIVADRHGVEITQMHSGGDSTFITLSSDQFERLLSVAHTLDRVVNDDMEIAAFEVHDPIPEAVKGVSGETYYTS